MIYDTSIIVNHQERARAIYDAAIGVITKLHLPVDAAATGHFSNGCVLPRNSRFNALEG